jgi:hypothetical protein
MKNILDKVLKFNANIIFVENNISAYALEYFQSKKISVISKIKIKDL